MKKLFTLIAVFLIIASATNAQWVESLNKPTQCFRAVNNTTIYAGCTSNIYKTTNEGVNWSLLYTLNQTVNCIVQVSPEYTFYVASGSDLYTTTNYGVNWTLVHTWPGLQVLTLQYIGTTPPVLLAGLSDGVYRSTDDGVSWDIPQLGGKRINEIKSDPVGSGVYASTSSGFYKTTNNGVSWNSITQSTQYNVNFFRRMGLNSNNQSVYVAGITGGFLYSTNTGVNWYKMSQASILSGEVLNNDNYILGDTLGRVFHINIDAPLTLWDKFVGLPSTPIQALCKSTNYVFAGSTGTTGQKIWRAPVSYVIDVKQISSEVPDKYKLEQNFPNPFNPYTTILYTISTKGLVTLKVYDLLGREVASLVNETQTPGTYTVDWNASNNPSGVYFYRLQTNNFTDTKRMVLVK